MVFDFKFGDLLFFLSFGVILFGICVFSIFFVSYVVIFLGDNNVVEVIGVGV